MHPGKQDESGNIMEAAHTERQVFDYNPNYKHTVYFDCSVLHIPFNLICCRPR